jgi:uncharacterized DUF497 family protein
MKFEWDPEKNRINLRKHGVRFEDAIRVFDTTELVLDLFDEQHSDFEERFISIGPITGGLVLVVWTEMVEDVVRVISARWATPHEQSLYRRRMEHRQ